MDKKDILKNVYDDFFGISKKKEEEELNMQIKESLESDTIEINMPEEKETINNQDQEKMGTDSKDEFLKKNFEKIDKLYIDDKSKETMKKIIEYIRKYNEGIEKNFISFNMCIFSKSKETEQEILHILNDSINFFNYLPQGDIGLTSFFDIESAKNIDEIYSSDNNIIVFENPNAFNTKEQNEKEKIIYKINQNLVDKEKQYLTVFVAKNKELLESIFLMSDELKNEFADFIINEINPDVQDVYNDILEKLGNSLEATDEFKIKLLDYISKTYPETDLSFTKYRDGLTEKILFNKEVPEYEKDKTMEEIFEELNSLVGLEKVKKMLNELVSLVELKSKAGDDLKLKNINLHMVFLGNPGTGKTTVARIVAEILYNLKYIKQNKLIEVSSKDLVAEYVGQTAPKTMSVIQKALGGVLFIDEAYSLASSKGQGSSYNEEAIATLIQAMENYRDELVVIFAGYTKEMQDFLDMNSGIVSRIGYTVEFEDYTENELLQIFMGMMKKAGFEVTPEAQDKVKNIITEYKDTKNFGNARFVRNVYEKSIVKHASNTAGKKQKKVLKTIKVEDISTDNLIKMWWTKGQFLCPKDIREGKIWIY